MTSGYHNALRTQNCWRRTHDLTVRPRIADSRSLLRIPWRAVRSSVRGMIWDVSGIRQLELLWGFPLQDRLCVLATVEELSMVLKSAPETKPAFARIKNVEGCMYLGTSSVKAIAHPPKIKHSVIIYSTLTSLQNFPFFLLQKAEWLLLFSLHTIKACDYMWPVDFRCQKATEVKLQFSIIGNSTLRELSRFGNASCVTDVWNPIESRQFIGWWRDAISDAITSSAYTGECAIHSSDFSAFTKRSHCPSLLRFIARYDPHR